MAVELDHFIVPSRDKAAAAKRLARRALLGNPDGELCATG